MQNSLLYYRHNSESDSYLNTDKFPRNRDHNSASKGPLRHFGDVIVVSNYLRSMQKLGIRHTIELYFRREFQEK